MMFKRKLTTPNVRIYIDCLFSPIKKAFTEAIREQFAMSRPEVYSEGVLALLETKKDLHARIFMGDCVELYRTKTNIITAKQRKGVVYTEMYVFKISAIDESLCRLYYKENNDIGDYEFKIWKCSRKKLNKSVFDEFPVSVGEVIPK